MAFWSSPMPTGGRLLTVMMMIMMCLSVHPQPISSPENLTSAASPVTDGQTVEFDITVFQVSVKMVYQRPTAIPFPSVWHKFTVTKGGVTTGLRIQDLTEDMFEPALELLAKYFMRDEPPCKYIEIHKHPSATAELRKLWSSTLQQRLSLVCLTDDDQIVSVNVLTVAEKDDKDEPFETDDKIWRQLFGAVDLVSRSVDVFSVYGVEQYLNALGLVVVPAWRGLTIGKVMLEARIPLCKALGIKVTVTVFTAGASQAVAKKAGFKVLNEITYEELAQKGFVFPGIEKDTKSSKLMALVI